MHKAAAIALTMLLLGAASASEGAVQQRLPKGYHWGRCLLIADGKTRISGKCAYELRGNGDFYSAGPRQVYEGIDYRNTEGYGALERSRDYWAVIRRDPDGTWQGYGNASVRATHGDQPYGELTQQVTCP